MDGWNPTLKDGKFSIRATYECLIAEELKENWGNITIRNRATRSANFIMWLAVQNRFAIKDRISRWMEDCSTDCVLCDGECVKLIWTVLGKPNHWRMK